MPKINHRPLARQGSDPAPKKQRRKAQHKCAACGSVFDRRRDCFAHMDTCGEIKRKLQNQRASATRWSVLYDTKDGMTHPKWFLSGIPIGYREVERAAREALKKESDWLVGIQDISPDEDQND